MSIPLDHLCGRGSGKTKIWKLPYAAPNSPFPGHFNLSPFPLPSFLQILDLCEDQYRLFDDDQYYRFYFRGEHSMELGGELSLTLDVKFDDRAQDLWCVLVESEGY